MTDSISRRTWLRTLSIATAGLALGGSGVAAATPGNGNGNRNGNEDGTGNGDNVKNECPEGTTLLAKYEFDDDTGELVFEKGRESLNIDGSEITFSNIVTKDGNEIVAFDWDSGPYDVAYVGVKAGQNVWKQEVNATSGTFDLRTFDEEGPVQAVSNIIFCIEICWQVDFGRGDVLLPPDYAEEGRKADLLLAATCDRIGDDGNPTGLRNGELNRLYLSENALPGKTEPIFTVENEQFNLETPGKASITFTINGDEPQDLHLACFEIPGPYQRGEVGAQVLFDSIEMDDVAPGPYTWTVDLPTL